MPATVLNREPENFFDHHMPILYQLSLTPHVLDWLRNQFIGSKLFKSLVLIAYALIAHDDC